MKAENRLEMGDEVMYFLGCRAKFKYFKIEMYRFDVSNFMILAQIFQLPSEFGWNKVARLMAWDNFHFIGEITERSYTPFPLLHYEQAVRDAGVPAAGKHWQPKAEAQGCSGTARDATITCRFVWNYTLLSVAGIL